MPELTKKQVVFFLHFNQNLVPYVRVAIEACYRGLFDILEKHTDITIMANFSGTLLNALMWLEPEFIDRIRSLIQKKQLELVGSTYAQNIMYSTSDTDNRRQIQLHRQLLKHLFQVEPTAFWNPERCWRPELASLIHEAGYSQVWIEDHILENSGVPADISQVTIEPGIQVFRDDKAFQKSVTTAIFKGNFEKIDTFLKKTKCPILCFAEDAEAIGLWQFEGQTDFELHSLPHVYWERFDRLLTQLKDDPRLQFTTLAKLSKHPAEYALPVIQKGQAQWMVKALQNPKAMYHEDGYQDWFDYEQRALEISYFKRFYQKITQALSTVANPLFLPADREPNPAVFQLKRHLDYLWAIHQYEFGCIGLLNLRDMQWEGIRDVFILLNVIRLARMATTSGILVDDINGDGNADILFIGKQQLWVLSPVGGKLLYWFDLASGREFVGNECTSAFGLTLESFMPTIALQVPKFSEKKLSFNHEYYALRRGAFNDILTTIEQPEPLVIHQENQGGKVINTRHQHPPLIPLDQIWHYDIQNNHIIFFWENSAIFIEKTYAFNTQEPELSVIYRLQNRSTNRLSFFLTIQNEWVPDYLTLLQEGKRALGVSVNGLKGTVFNTVSQIGLEMTVSNLDSIIHQSSFLGEQLNPSAHIQLSPSDTIEWEIKVKLIKSET